MNESNPTHFEYIARDPAGNIASRGFVEAERAERLKSHLAQELFTVTLTPIDEQGILDAISKSTKLQRIRKSWQIASSVARQTPHAITIFESQDGDGMYDTLNIAQIGGQSVISLNRNGDTALAFGELVENIWGQVENTATGAAARLLEGNENWSEESQFDVARENIWSAIYWASQVLKNPGLEIEWCWVEVEEYSWGFNERLMKEEDLPSNWLSQPSPQRELHASAWCWALKRDGEVIALINLFANEAISMNNNVIAGTFDDTFSGPKFVDSKDSAPQTISIGFDASEALGKYVYALRDPRNQEVFYIGKGTGNRLLQHIVFADKDKTGESAKLARIKEIENSGSKVEHLLIRHGIETDDEAFAIEQAVIDAYSAAKLTLTNLVKGHASTNLGLKSIEAFLEGQSTEALEKIDEPLVMFYIQKDWRPDMSEAEIYACTRAFWNPGINTRAKAKYAFGVAHGIVRGIYRIDSWKKSEVEEFKDRYEFDGVPATELAHLIGKRVPETTKPGFPRQYFLFLEGYPGA